MRYEWRKSLEDGYERQVAEIRNKTLKEKLELKTGPTTISALGSHYEQ